MPPRSGPPKPKNRTVDDTAEALQKQLQARLRDALVKISGNRIKEDTSFPLPPVYYYAKASSKKLGATKVPGLLAWNSSLTKLIATEFIEDAAPKFLAALPDLAEWAAKGLAVRPEANIVRWSARLALTKDLDGTLYGVTCLFRIALSEPRP